MKPTAKPQHDARYPNSPHKALWVLWFAALKFWSPWVLSFLFHIAAVCLPASGGHNFAQMQQPWRCDSADFFEFCWHRMKYNEIYEIHFSALTQLRTGLKHCALCSSSISMYFAKDDLQVRCKICLHCTQCKGLSELRSSVSPSQRRLHPRVAGLTV